MFVELYLESGTSSHRVNGFFDSGFSFIFTANVSKFWMQEPLIKRRKNQNSIRNPRTGLFRGGVCPIAIARLTLFMNQMLSPNKKPAQKSNRPSDQQQFSAWIESSSQHIHQLSLLLLLPQSQLLCWHITSTRLISKEEKLVWPKGTKEHPNKTRAASPKL